jgi:hypothetical protein
MRVWGCVVVLAGVVAASARARSVAAEPPLVERLARWPDLGDEFDVPRRFPREVTTWAWSPAGDRLGSQTRVLGDDERALLESLVKAQRHDLAEPFRRVLSHAPPWLRDEALAALPHGRLASGHYTAYVGFEAARRADVAFVAAFLPELGRLAVESPPRAGIEHDATPVLATKVLLLLTRQAQGAVRTQALDAAIQGIALLPHWTVIDEFHDLFEAVPDLSLTVEQCARLAPAFRSHLRSGSPREFDAGEVLARLRDEVGLDLVHDAYVETRAGPHLVSLARGRHPRALEAVRVALERTSGGDAKPGGGPPIAPVPPADHDLRAAALLADPSLVTPVLRRVARDRWFTQRGAEVLAAIGTPEARHALLALMDEAVEAGDVLAAHALARLALRGPVDDVVDRAARVDGEMRAALAQALAEVGARGVEHVDGGALRELSVKYPRGPVGALSYLVARTRLGDADAAAGLEAEVERLRLAASADRKQRAAYDHAVRELSKLDVLSPGLEALLLSSLTVDSIRTLGHAGTARARAALGPRCAYGNSPWIREAARQAYGRLERRGK